ncbi:hypothetical protein J8748_26290 [Klebsiella pneumoniae]
MTVAKKGPPAPAHIEPEALEKAITAARKIREANPERYKSIPVQPKLF